MRLNIVQSMELASIVAVAGVFHRWNGGTPKAGCKPALRGMDGTIIGFGRPGRDLEGFIDREPTFEKAGYYRASRRDGKGRRRGWGGPLALEIH